MAVLLPRRQHHSSKFEPHERPAWSRMPASGVDPSAAPTSMSLLFSLEVRSLSRSPPPSRHGCGLRSGSVQLAVRPSKADIASLSVGSIESSRRGSPCLSARAPSTCLSLGCGTRWQTLLLPTIGSKQSLGTAAGSDRARHAVRTRENEPEGGCVSGSTVSGIECRESGPMRGGPASVRRAPFDCRIAHIRTRCPVDVGCVQPHGRISAAMLFGEQTRPWRGVPPGRLLRPSHRV